MQSKVYFFVTLFFCQEVFGVHKKKEPFHHYKKDSLRKIEYHDTIRTLRPLEKMILVPERLVQGKIKRYLTESSTAAIAMACCQAHVHRKCLKIMFHEKNNGKLQTCPCCQRGISRLIYGQSRNLFIPERDRVKNCTFCNEQIKR